MSVFSDWFFGTKPKPVPTPVPTPVPPPVPDPVGLPELDLVPFVNQIRIEKKVVTWWKEEPVPFNGMLEVSSRKLTGAYRFYYVRVTVLAGKLTMRKPVLTGFNSPNVKGYVKGQIFKAGESFTANFYVGPVDVAKPGRHDISSISVDTIELGVITTQSAMVTYAR